jgi:hypothetical protein
MSDINTNISKGGQFLAVLAAAASLSTDDMHGTSLNFSSKNQTRNDHPNVITLSNNGMQTNGYLSRETKVEMVLKAGMTEPGKAPNATENRTPLEVIEVFTPQSSQNSPLTAPTLNNSMTSSDLSKEADQETNVSVHPTFSTENAKFNVDLYGNTLSVPSERTPEKNSEKNYINFEDGLDTDDEIGPFWDTVEGEEDIDDDLDQLPLDTDEVLEAISEQQPTIANENEVIAPLMEEVIRMMLNSELKSELKRQGLSQNGNNTILTKRLLDTLQKPIEAEGQPEPVPNGFPSTAKWRQLIQNPTTVTEPTRPSNMRGPTVSDGEDEFKKFDFPDLFDCPPFTEMSEIYETDRNGKVLKDRQGKIRTTSEVRYNGRAKSEWLKKHKLTNASKPSSWFEALLPLKRNTGDPVTLVTINEWTTYANKKAMLANAGVAGGVYKDSPKEVQQYLALYIFQGLSPSPQIKMKFVPQKEDPINGSDICYKIFGRNGDRWHKMFKAFFSCQDPLKAVP